MIANNNKKLTDKKLTEYFDEPQTYTPHKDIIDKAISYSYKVVPTVNYRDSKQKDPEKLRHDAFIGKLGEDAIYNIFKEFGVLLFNKNGSIGPDYKIYEGKEKSWHYDLYLRETGLSVKTQSVSNANKINSYDWTFQYIKDGRRDPILDKKEALVAFVTCDDTNRFYECTVYPLCKIGELTFCDPKRGINSHLIGKKKFVYRDDLPYFVNKNKIDKTIINTKQVNNIEDAWDYKIKNEK